MITPRSEDMYAQDSIDLLSKSGIEFKEHDARGISKALDHITHYPMQARNRCWRETDHRVLLWRRTGIDVNEFGELLMTSGIVLNEDVKWISFHSGYDYGYLLKGPTFSNYPAHLTCLPSCFVGHLRSCCPHQHRHQQC